MPDLAAIRRTNALLLFDEFVRNTVTHPDAAALRGLERRFAERVHIQPSYWSQIKSRARQIGERLARQIEAHCGKPHGWLDVSHAPVPPAPVRAQPADDDERFIVELVLAYYRRDPALAKGRLLAVLGEALGTASVSAPAQRPQKNR